MIQHGLTSHFTIFGIAMVCSVVGCDLAVIWVMAGKEDFFVISRHFLSRWTKRTFWGVPHHGLYGMIQHDLTLHSTIFGILVVYCIVKCGFGVIWVMAGKDDFFDLSRPFLSRWTKRTFWGVPHHGLYGTIQHDLTLHSTIFGILVVCCIVG
jgi:hypothetical protein